MDSHFIGKDNFNALRSHVLVNAYVFACERKDIVLKDKEKGLARHLNIIWK